jgi:hypothetical protein
MFFYLFKFFLTNLLHHPNSIAKPIDKNYCGKMNKALALCLKHVGGLSHSDQPAEVGESYPKHLEKCLKMYARLKGPANDRARDALDRNVPVQNRAQQIQQQGLQRPLGGENGDLRFSTQTGNKAAGHQNAKRGNSDALAPSFQLSDDDDDNDSPSDPKKKKLRKRLNPQGTINDFRDKSKATTEAMQAITNSLSRNKKPDNSEMAFKEKQLELNKSYLVNEQKLQEKKSFIMEKRADMDCKLAEMNCKVKVANLEMKRESADLKKKKADVDLAKAALDNNSKRLDILTQQKSEAFSNLSKYGDNRSMKDELEKEIKSLSSKINTLVERMM